MLVLRRARLYRVSQRRGEAREHRPSENVGPALHRDGAAPVHASRLARIGVNDEGAGRIGLLVRGSSRLEHVDRRVASRSGLGDVLPVVRVGATGAVQDGAAEALHLGEALVQVRTHESPALAVVAHEPEVVVLHSGLLDRDAFATADEDVTREAVWEHPTEESGFVRPRRVQSNPSFH